jgi:hypothetical protein
MVWTYTSLTPEDMSGRALTTTVDNIEHIESAPLRAAGIAALSVVLARAIVD